MNEDRRTCALGLSGQQLSAWRDHLVPEAMAKRIGQHVGDCAACQHHLAQFARIAASIQYPAPDLRARTWQGVQARLSQREQRTMRPPRVAAFSGIGAAAAVALVALLFVLVINHRPHSDTGPVVSTTATKTVSATETCTNALPGASSASAGTSFADLTLPAHSVSTAPTKIGGGGDGQFTLFALELCTSQTSSAAINTFFAHLPTQSWQPSATFPLDGTAQVSCGNNVCWAKDVRYIRLSEPLTDLGGGIARYHLTLATAPIAPECSGSAFSPAYYYQLPVPQYVTTNVYANIPLPPLARIVPNNASGGQRGYEICSAGTVASITTFMNSHLTALGWASLVAGTWSKNGFDLTLQINAATGWLIGWRDPDSHP